MEGFTERQIATINTIEQRIAGHKNWLMAKKRIRYTFKQIVGDMLDNLHPRIYKKALPLDCWEKREAYYRGVGEYDYIDSAFVPFNIGDIWGGPDVTAFFRREIVIPEEIAGDKVYVQMYVGGDSLVKVNGKSVQGLDPFRNSFLLTECAVAGEKFLVEIESFCFYATPTEGVNKRKFELSALTVIDEEINNIYWDLKVALNLLEIRDIPAEFAAYVEEVFHDIVTYIDLDTEDESIFLEKLHVADKIVKTRIYESERFRAAGLVDLIGHSHLDIIYMWDYKEFVRKTGRTHATMLALLDRYPEFRFCQSQAVTYMEIKKNFPDIYERIREYVKEGRWEVIGGLWVECDCNLPSGESFVRQLLEGRKFFREEFGITPKTAWLPDVFGNSYGMPQILARSGINYFVSHKPCVWNDTNPIAHNTFWWRGADGSKVMVVLSPSHFVGTCEPNHVKLNWDFFNEKHNIGESIYCYGWGDGGGGVSEDMIENATRMKHIVGMPDTRIINAEDALDSIYACAVNSDIPTLQNEIYLEAHRAVATIRTEIKKYNRICERLLHDAELYSVMAEPLGHRYDKEGLEEFCRAFLTNQFHDILPGTHVNDAYKGIIADYETIVARGEKIRDEALATIIKNIKYDTARGKAVVVFNPTSHEANLIAKIDALYNITDEDGEAVAVQTVKSLSGEEEHIFVAEAVPPFSHKVFYLSDYDTNAENCATVSERLLENRFFRIEFNEVGEIVSIFDKAYGREMLKGASNKLRLYYDNASNHDAWDIVEEYKEFPIDISGGNITPFENGPVLASVIFKKKFLGCTFEQKIVVYNNIPRIDFETRADWHGEHKMLRTDFDFDLTTSKFTTNLAYASLERPTNAFNSYDRAKFEVTAQDFVNISESGYGVSIMSDLKSGYGIEDTKVSLNLLRAPIYPDISCDRGVNEFTYSITSHSGTILESAEAFAEIVNTQIAHPLQICGEYENECLFYVENANVFIEAVKKSEDGEGVIVRLVEKDGFRVGVDLYTLYEIESVTETDLMEDEIAPVEYEKCQFNFTIKPFEIRTFKVKYK